MTRKGILVGSAVLIATIGFFVTSLSQAEDELAITELYGQGVHAFFEGDFATAHKHLSDAIELGTDDPRVYYFRGLALNRLGRADEAQKDFAQGGKLEAAGVEQYYPIGRSLERIQGEERLEIEKHRKQARIAIRLRRKKIEQARIEAFKRDERLRGTGPKPNLGSPSEKSASEEDPFGSSPAPTKTAPTGGDQGPEATPDTKPAEPNNNDPFAAPDKKADQPKSDDPFAAPDKKTESKPSQNPDPFAEDDGKSGPKKSDSKPDDPFGN